MRLSNPWNNLAHHTTILTDFHHNVHTVLINVSFVFFFFFFLLEYFFTNREAMQKSIDAGEFIESAVYNQNLYGTR